MFSHKELDVILNGRSSYPGNGRHDGTGPASSAVSLLAGLRHVIRPLVDGRCAAIR